MLDPSQPRHKVCFYGDHAKIGLSILLAAGRRDQVPLLADAPAVLVGRLARASRLGCACWWRGARKASSEPCADLEARVVRLERLLVQRGEVEVKPDGPRVLRRQRQLPAVTVRRGFERVRSRGRSSVVVPAQLLGERQHHESDAVKFTLSHETKNRSREKDVTSEEHVRETTCLSSNNESFCPTRRVTCACNMCICM